MLQLTIKLINRLSYSITIHFIPGNKNYHSCSNPHSVRQHTFTFIMSSEKVLSSASASASASAPLASPHVDVCKGINGLDKVVLRDPRGSSAEVPNLMIACFVFSISVAGFVNLFWKFGFVFVKSRA